MVTKIEDTANIGLSLISKGLKPSPRGTDTSKTVGTGADDNVN